VARIPVGWSFLTSDPDYDRAWELAAEYKISRERVRGDLRVMVRTMHAAGVHWILTREEMREGELAA